MPHHTWGDEWFLQYGEQLEAAMDYIFKECKKHGMHVFMKEKYGTVRYEFTFAWFWPTSWPIYNYFYRGYMYYRWPKWLIPLENVVFKVLLKTGYVAYKHEKQIQAFKRVVLDAVEKYPDVRDEVLTDLKYQLTDLEV